MQGKHLFEYAVVRIVPRVERGEFLNVGVVLYCAPQKFLKFLFAIDEEKLKAFYNNCDVLEIEEYLKAFEQICLGNKEGSKIAQLPIAERFRWLTATRSTILQTSKVHPGFCVDAEETLQQLFIQLVQ